MTQISEIASVLSELTERGICLIPVGETDKAAKIKWGGITRPLSILELYDLMGSFDTNAVAMICGKVSGNLFLIDFDVKNKKELGSGFLGLFSESFKDLTFKVEGTPSGGSHILYRVIGIPEGIEFKFEKNIAERWSTKEELLINPSEKKKCFIEIKGNGQICQCYPSPGYIHVTGSIGEVSWDDHLRVLGFLRSFNEVEKEIKPKKDIRKEENSWYIEGKNPFDNFNLSHAGGILEEFGWNRGRCGNKYELFSRPGIDSKWVGASYDKETRMYNIFTASSELDSRPYNPSDLLCALKYGWNKSELYSWLVSQGYGVLRRGVELGLIKKSAKFGIKLPENISKEAKRELEEEKLKVKEKYPHGLFWTVSEEGVVEISQKKIDEVVIGIGFRNIVGEGLVHLDGWLVKRVDESRVFHALINYILRVKGFKEVDEVYCILEDIEEEERGDVEKVYNAYSSFINKYGKITIEHLKEFGKIQDGKVLISGKGVSYKFFRNCYVEILSGGVEALSYSELGDKLIFEHLIINRDFSIELNGNIRDSLPYKFFSKAIGIDNSFLSVLGYLTHDFIDDSMNNIFVGLGSPGCGKNVLFNLLNHITSVHVIDGRQIELDKNLLQSYNGERVLVISDVEERFKYDFFKNFSSGAASLKKLYKDVVVLKRKSMPKPVILTNFSYKMVEGLERRIVDVEFTDFFSKIKGGVATYFGLMFPGYDLEDKGGWSDFDWNCFDSICMLGISKFLEIGSIEPKVLSDKSWNKRFQVSYGYLFEYFNEKFDEWVGLGKVKCAVFDSDHLSWCSLHRIRNVFSAQKYNKAISEYCEYMRVGFDSGATLKDEHGFNAKFKVFKKIESGDIGVESDKEKMPF